ncbi:B12-binding domain-containing protein [Cognatishimia sp. F0-27]|uniref:cobalamin B12-binding domain-containing protein n=1 Tax=Cognatishimia sp. F0-27 TaxID=2816855 RepID=UPI001D0C5F31|nr:cobalamin B12-binding domain-containing protein [Cognatishimia sp. F0-27]MCC1491026.1 cobalamin B12-binding domain-containing protein [Cognatishimia sp. F0-27]
MTEFDDAFFDNSQARIEALRTQFSDRVIEGLARDVVKKMASRTRLAEGVTDLQHPEETDIEALVNALIHEDREVASTMMRQIQRKGVTLDVLYSRYLAAASVRMGMLWDENRLTFAQVSFGVGRIFELVRMLREALPPTRITHAESVLFSMVPGERHGLGVEMAAELFRQNGWDVQLLIDATHDEIMTEIDKIRCLVLGVSSGGRRSAEALARLIAAVRIVHPEVFIIVSGQVVNNAPDLIELIQPDSAVATVEDALSTMETLSRRETENQT